jgi:5-formyltetrahydrofolate cyclo-ligase
MDEAEALLRHRVKRELRKRMRGVRATMPASAVAERSTRIVTRVQALEAWSRARSVAFFWPMAGRNEVDLRGLVEPARAAGKSLLLPRIDPEDGSMVLALFEREDELVESGQGPMEPPTTAGVPDPAEIDLVLVPALVVDVRGHRIGYGAGFYDRMLPRYAPPAVTVAVAFDFQLVAEVPILPGDVPVALVVTDSQTLIASEAGSDAVPLAERSAAREGVRTIPRPSRR